MVHVVEIFPYWRQGPICVMFINTMAADDLMMQGARLSSGMILTY